MTCLRRFQVPVVLLAALLSSSCSTSPLRPRDSATTDGQTTTIDASHPERDADGLVLTVAMSGEGVGRVVSMPEGIDCEPTCHASFSPGKVKLSAKAAGGNYFDGWGGDCAGMVGPECTVTVASAKTITARFAAVANNLVFATSTSVDGAFGGIVAADALCAEAARRGGLPGSYLAWLSTGAVNAASRLGAARGWVRMDGRPFADTVADMTTGRRILNPIVFDETGTAITAAPGRPSYAWTGTRADGTATDAEARCSDYTDNSTMLAAVAPLYGGPDRWTTGWGAGRCDVAQHLLCFGVDRNSALVIPKTAGKTMFVSRQKLEGGQVGARAAAVCASEGAAAGLIGEFVPYLATLDRPASALLSPSATYIRPDGQWIGNYEHFATGSALSSGIWQTADGIYLSAGDIWIGADPGMTGTVPTTCNDWQDSGGTGQIGETSTAAGWYDNASNYPCVEALSVVCVET